MKVTGIIAEYNPFHKGHAYHIEETRRQSGCDYILAVISGDYVQRGEPAIINKYARTRMALSCGADLVLEMPAIFATSAAEDFAGCGVSILAHTGIVDSISFGSEAGNLSLLKEAADALSRETPQTKKLLQEAMKRGLSYPAAREYALKEQSLFKEIRLKLPPGFFSSPNNILGMEYLRAIKRQNAPLDICTLQRRSAGYHEDSLLAELPSATAIRKAILALPSQEFEKQDVRLLERSLPKSCWQILNSTFKTLGPMEADDFSHALGLKLLEMKEEGYTAYADVSLELSQSIRNQLDGYTGFSSMAEAVKSKAYTRARINRALLHILLGMKEERRQELKENQYVPYLRILGFKKSAAPLLTALKANASLPLVTKVASAKNQLSPKACGFFEEELAASHLYRMTAAVKFGNPSLPTEYTAGLVILSQ